LEPDAFWRDFTYRYKLARVQGPVARREDRVAFGLDEPRDDVISSRVHRRALRNRAGGADRYCKRFVWLTLRVRVAKQAPIL
jgi:hypothetical protein